MKTDVKIVGLFGLLMSYSAEGVDHGSAQDPSEVMFGPGYCTSGLFSYRQHKQKKSVLDKHMMEIISVAPPQSENKIFSLSATIFY